MKKALGITVIVILGMVAVFAIALNIGPKTPTTSYKSQHNDSFNFTVDTGSSSTVPAVKSLTVDSAKINKLKSNARIVKDEYSSTVWYYPKSAPKFVNQNGIFGYFGYADGSIGEMRFCLRYEADDWLFIKDVDFLIDGQVLHYTPSEVKHDNADGRIWEWVDEPAADEGILIMVALSSAKTAKMKLNGLHYYKEKIITPAQIKGMLDIMQLYTAMKGPKSNTP